VALSIIDTAEESHIIYQMTIKRNKPLGAPTKLTPELQKEFVKQIRRGNYIETVCGYCSIATSTFRAWMSTGKDDLEAGKTTEFSDFMAAVRGAEATAEIRLVDKWQKIIDARLKLLDSDPEKVDYRIIKDFLASRHNDRWGKNFTQTTVDGKLEIDVKTLSNEELQDIVDGKLRRPPYPHLVKEAG